MCVRLAQPEDEQRTRSSREKTNKRNVRNRSDNGGANQKMDLKVREMAKEPEKLLI